MGGNSLSEGRRCLQQTWMWGAGEDACSIIAKGTCSGAIQEKEGTRLCHGGLLIIVLEGKGNFVNGA